MLHGVTTEVLRALWRIGREMSGELLLQPDVLMETARLDTPFIPKLFLFLADQRACACVLRVNAIHQHLVRFVAREFSKQPSTMVTARDLPEEEEFQSAPANISKAWVLVQLLLESSRLQDMDRSRAIEIARQASQLALDGYFASFDPGYEAHFPAKKSGAPLDREGTLAWWGYRSEAGACWIVRRLRAERDIEVLNEAASLLADIGRAAIWPILDELERGGPADQTDTLLLALRLLAEDGILRESTEEVLPVLQAMLPACRSVDTRIGIYEVLAVLRPGPEEEVWAVAQRAEQHPEGKSALEDALLRIAS